MKIKKYPLFISLIISCVIVVASLFVLGFCGINLGTDIGGGSQIEITMPNDANQKDYVKIVKETIGAHGFNVETSYVEDKFIADESELEYTEKVLVVKIPKTNISDENEKDIRYALADNLDLDVEKISAIENITSVVTAKNVLSLGLAIGIIAVLLFIFGAFRYNIFAGVSFILSFLHNIIVYIALLILTRVNLNLVSLGIMIVLTLVMSMILVSIYEKHREDEILESNEKLTSSELLIGAESKVIKPFAFIAGAVCIFALMILFVPVFIVKMTAINAIICLLVTVYTTAIVGPASYAGMLEMKDFRLKAKLSRNDTINKQIKRKIKVNKNK